MAYLILLFTFITMSFATEMQPCIDLTTENTQNIEHCQGQLIRIQGQHAPMIMQHPTGLYNSFDINTGKMKKSYENYVETVLGQIVVVTQSPIQCPDTFIIKGYLDIVDLGGAANTKNSYKNYWIKATAITCLETM